MKRRAQKMTKLGLLPSSAGGALEHSPARKRRVQSREKKLAPQGRKNFGSSLSALRASAQCCDCLPRALPGAMLYRASGAAGQHTQLIRAANPQ
jgi:hypothetical protein